MPQATFYWHDYETFGANPSLDRPSQFAGIRTDADFNIIGEPLVIYCQPASDMLPQPQACLITGITPQQAKAKGLPEAEFIRLIHKEMARPSTCSVGYNSIRFDDEVTRYTLYRNFYDAYEREWKNGNSRWDLIDMARVCRALRPEGINWPDHDDGTPSFKLEHITAANGISHEAAHDALSDVHATIALAKLIKTKQPKLYDYVLSLRNKRTVAAMLDVVAQAPVLHTSAMFPASRYCTSLVMPLAAHPSNKNAIVAYDLSVDPTPLLTLSAEQIREKLYTPTAELAEGEQRIALKNIHINRCPIVATSKLLDEKLAARIQLDLPQARQHYQQLKNSPGLAEKVAQVFAADAQGPAKTDPDVMLYSGGFFSQQDKSVMAQVRSASPEQLQQQTFAFSDSRLAEMLFRYRARNYPESLTAEEAEQWQEFRFLRLTDPEAGASIVMDDFIEEIETLMADAATTAAQREILEQLLHYSDELLV
ncbi:exodeoxyribonuclease I [Dasania marina]|uniref:exodeoxyribonuclease I n=1 Tax=Dasania marina TaxID=471499 RepID=UPI000365A4C2|nr:exodeoxyribonuclease I [Dasania marina]